MVEGRTTFDEVISRGDHGEREGEREKFWWLVWRATRRHGLAAIQEPRNLGPEGELVSKASINLAGD